MNTEKKIIGYKIKNEGMRPRIARALDVTEENAQGRDYFMTPDSITGQEAKALGVLDIWFEPVYEVEKFEPGTWVTVKDGFKGEGSVGDDGYGGHGIQYLPKTFKIERVDQTSLKINPIMGEWLYWSNDHGVYHIALRKATEEEIQGVQKYTIEVRYNNGVIPVEVDEKGTIWAKGLTVSYNEICAAIGEAGLKIGSWDVQFKVERIDVGCHKGLYVEDLKKVLRASKERNPLPL